MKKILSSLVSLSLTALFSFSLPAHSQQTPIIERCLGNGGFLPGEPSHASCANCCWANRPGSPIALPETKRECLTACYNKFVPNGPGLPTTYQGCLDLFPDDFQTPNVKPCVQCEDNELGRRACMLGVQTDPNIPDATKGDFFDALARSKVRGEECRKKCGQVKTDDGKK